MANGPANGYTRPQLLIGAGLICGLIGSAVAAVVQARWDRGFHSDLLPVLLVAAVAAGFAVVPTRGRASISAAFLIATLAAPLLGPTSAALCVVISEAVAAARLKTERVAVAFNVLIAAGSAIVAANFVHLVASAPSDSIGFYLAVAAAGVIILLLGFGIAATHQQFFREERTLDLQLFVEYLPSEGLNIALAVAGAAIYLKIGLGGIVFALLAVFTFTYMAHLLEQSRQRAEQYVSLSWGVLGGLMRALDIRDQRAARHAAAVARFARDMAQAVGMSEHEIELAHTAGLLHDIGRFALSDRVFERGRTLTDEDWVAIQRHPELGAEMLKDLGLYGPVAEIVLSHHERIDGRGYPHGLTGAQIPEIAKIIAVAEIYDTLTASDTYRTRMSSFEALRELRRVAGSQVESGYVETLAGLLSGEGVDYRHADAVKFDAELDMERRIKEAGARG